MMHIIYVAFCIKRFTPYFVVYRCQIRTLEPRLLWISAVKVDTVSCNAELCFTFEFPFQKGAGSDWGHKAHQSLIVTRGKGFRHEKNKKKKGSYVGGTLNLSVNSIKFDD